MPTCFFITPLGESGSETRRTADDLRDLLLKPVLEPLGFTILRGDHQSEAGQIDIDVVRAIQESDLCIADVSIRNGAASPNVFYEFGRRDETGKPLILIKEKGTDDLPVDVATRRYIEYDLDSRRGLIDAMTQLRSFVTPIAENGFEASGTGASLSDLAEILKRVERKVDRLSSGVGGGGSGGERVTPVVPKEEEYIDPTDLFRLALRRRDIPMAERAMERLAGRMEKNRWLDQVVESAAAIGSKKAGDILIENAFDFMDSTQSFKSKIEYLGCLVSNLNRTDREEEYRELVEQICDLLKAGSEHEDPNERIQIYNQLNRLYYGVYVTTDDEKWLDMAITELEIALKVMDKGYLHFNLATCLKERKTDGALDEALRHALICIDMEEDEEPDAGHLELACRLLHDAGDPRLSDYLEMLEKVNAVKASLLRSSWRI